jgi:CBS-domain-containing membrane protein
MMVGAVLGLFAAGWVMAYTRQVFPGLALLFAVIGAIAVGLEGPAVLRHIEKDGKDHGTADRH